MARERGMNKMIAVLLLVACSPDATEKEIAPSLDYDVVQATVSMDYAVGSLATIDKESHGIGDQISSISGDPVLDFDGTYLWQLNRYRYDTLRKYDPANLSVPIAEVSLRFGTEESSNPQAAVRCDEKLFVSQHDKSELLVLDIDTLDKIGTVPLDAFIDADGSPEAATMVNKDSDSLYLGLQRLDRNQNWSSVGSVIVEVDCSSQEIVSEYDFGADIRLYDDENSILMSTSARNEQNGGIFTMTEDGAFTPYVEMDEHEILDVTSIGEYLYFITITEDFGQQEVYCASKEDGILYSLRSFSEFLTFIQSDGDSLWIGAHWGWNDPENAMYGTHVWSVEGCSILEEVHIKGEFAPFDMVFVK